MKGSWIVIDCELRRLPVDQLQPTDHHARTLKSPRFLSLLHRNTGRCRGRQRYGAACREQLRRQFILTEQRNASQNAASKSQFERSTKPTKTDYSAGKTCFGGSARVLVLNF